MNEDRLTVRRAPAHGPASHPTFGDVQFVTVCTKDRQKVLASPEAHTLILECWQKADHWLVGRYVIMPDHIHLFCTEKNALSLDLEAWIRHWKTAVAKSWPGGGGKLWQRSHWDTRMRTESSYWDKWEYVRENPVRAGLVERAEDWPYSGEIFKLHP